MFSCPPIRNAQNEEIEKEQSDTYIDQLAFTLRVTPD
jgi:hypothetical protein